MVNRRTFIAFDPGARPGAAGLADPPVASYIFPAGGQRGTTVEVRVGGLNLLSKASLEMLGPGVEASGRGPSRSRRSGSRARCCPCPTRSRLRIIPKDYAGHGDHRRRRAARSPRLADLERAGGVPARSPSSWATCPRSSSARRTATLVPEPVTLAGDDQRPDLSPRGRGPLDVPAPRRRGADRAASTRAGWAAARPLARSAATPTAGGSPSRLRAGRLTTRAAGLRRPEGRDLHRQDPRRQRQGGPGLRLPPDPDDWPERRAGLPAGRPARCVGVSFAAEGLGVSGRAEPVTLPGPGPGAAPSPRSCGSRGGSAVVEVDDLPAVSEAEPNDEPIAGLRYCDLPGVGDGRIERAGDVDTWAVPLEQGPDLRARPPGRAARFQPRRPPELDRPGRQGAGPGRRRRPHAGGDPVVDVSGRRPSGTLLRARQRPISLARRARLGVPAAGRRKPRGGLPAQPSPADTLAFPRRRNDQAEGRGGTARRVCRPDRPGGRGVPEGISVAKTVIVPNAGSVDLTFKAGPNAPIRSARLTVRGTAEIGGRQVERVATRRAADRRFPRSTASAWRSRCRRRSRSRGRSTSAGRPGARSDHRRYLHRAERIHGADRGPARRPPGPAPSRGDRTGRDRASRRGGVRIPGHAPPLDGDRPDEPDRGGGDRRGPRARRHRARGELLVAPKTELQIVAVIAPGLLGLEARRTSVAASSGKAVEVPVKVSARQGGHGPVHVELIAPEWLRGLSAEPLVLNDGDDEGILRIRLQYIP